MDVSGVGSFAATDFDSGGICQQFTYGVVSKGVLAESFVEICGKCAANTAYCVRNVCGNSGRVCEILRKFVELFLQ